MKYLCSYHQEAMKYNESAAVELWHSAMCHGKEAYDESNFRLAQSFFGSAFEISIIRLNEKADTESFSCQHLADSGRLLTNTLCCVDQFDEAEEILLFSHSFLLEALSDKKKTYDERRYLMRLVQEFLRRATTLLRIRGKKSYADSITLISHKVTANCRELLMH